MATADDPHSPTAEEIMEYLDGEGTPAARGGIEAHLAQCGPCQLLASDHRRLAEDIGRWQVGSAPASLRAPVAAPSRRRLLAGRFLMWSPSRRLLVLGAAAVLVALVFTPQLRRAAGDRHDTAPSSEVAGRLGGAARSSDRALQLGARETLESSTATSVPIPPPPEALQRALRQPAIVRTATLRIVAKDFTGVRTAVEGIVAAASGVVDQMTTTSDPDSARTLRGTLRIPVDRVSEVADRLRQLGQVVEDTQGSEDVSDQLVDLDARLKSARATELRLTELLRTRTGSLSDVLDVERELARVRVDIERLDAQGTNIGRRVSYATLTLLIVEERKAGVNLGSLSLASRVRIAAADGVEAALESIAWTLLSVLQAGPFLVLWAGVLGTAWLIFRRVVSSRGRQPR